MGQKSKFFKIGVEGDTTDGRRITREQLQQMADSYNPATYSARIFLEHIRGTLPDGPFRAYGDVTALKTEDVTLNGEKKLALLAQIEPTPDLVAMTKAKQKVFSSMEIDPNFAKTNKAYLVGMGVTDSPASLGTDMLTFASTAQVNPLASRKLRPENLFSAGTEVEIEFEDDAPTLGESLLTKVKQLLSRKDKQDVAQFADAAQAIETLAESQRTVLDENAALKREIAALKTAAETDRKAFADLKAALDKTPANPSRPPASGGNGGAQVTDC